MSSRPADFFNDGTFSTRVLREYSSDELHTPSQQGEHDRQYHPPPKLIQQPSYTPSNTTNNSSIK